MSLKRFTRISEAPVLTPGQSVMDAARRMKASGRGAVLVVDDTLGLLGIFTERDLACRVVAEGLDPEATHLRDVMTNTVIRITEDTSLDEALSVLQKNKIRHLPLADSDGNITGLLSLRYLLHEQIEDLTYSLQNLEAYLNDAAGG